MSPIQQQAITWTTGGPEEKKPVKYWVHTVITIQDNAFRYVVYIMRDIFVPDLMIYPLFSGVSVLCAAS